MWGRLLNFEADQPYVAEENPSIVRTPLVIAMWEPMAKALGYPRKKLGFGDILKLARSNQGWAAYGHPEFGAFKLVHTNPDFSTCGPLGGRRGVLLRDRQEGGPVEQDIAKARPTVKDIERSIVHYGDTTLFIADQLRKSGPGYASAVAMEEATLVAFNQDRGSQPKLVAIYPDEGTFFSDNPYIALNAPWVTADQKAGAESFGDVPRRQHRRARRPRSSASAAADRKARAAADGGQRRRPRRSPSASSACPSRACSPR